MKTFYIQISESIGVEASGVKCEIRDGDLVVITAIVGDDVYIVFQATEFLYWKEIKPE